jgi:hypothetical protein
MTTLVIGEHELALARPDDLAERILAATGLGIEEAPVVLLVSSPALLSAAVFILTDGSVAQADIGEALAGVDMAAVIEVVAPFYNAEPKHGGK